VSDLSRRQPQPLIETIGPLTDEQAARVVAIFNRYLYAPDKYRQDETPDAA
jgi:hypothetical protein